MAGLVSRASLIVKSKVSKLLDKAEKPTETLDYSYEKQLELLQNVRRGVADVTTSKKRLQVQAEKLEQEVVKLEGQARQAITAGRDDLARRALERKSGIQQELVGLDAQVQQLQGQQDKLIEQQKSLEVRVEQFRSQKEVIKAQYSAAEASARIGEAVTGIGNQMSDMGTALQRAKDKTEEMQARASAMDELVQSGALQDLTSTENDIDRELAALSSSTQVDSELAKLRAELGAGGAAAPTIEGTAAEAPAIEPAGGDADASKPA